MSSIAEGLTFGEETPELPEGEIRSNADFMASLGKDLGVEIEVEGNEPPATPEVPAPAGEAEGAEGDNSQPEGEEALTPEQKELKELHALLGRQSQELGELRKAVEQRSVEKDEEEVEQFRPTAPITPDVLAEIEEAIETNGGEQMAVWALTNRPDLYESVLDTWADQGGAAARRAAQFDIRYQTALAAETSRIETEEMTEFQKGLAAQLDTQVSELAPSYGITPGTPEVDQLLADTVSEAPKSIQDLLVSKDEKAREDGIRVVLALAAAKTATTAPEKDTAAGEALVAALAREKGRAALGGGSLQRAPSPAETGEASQPTGFDIDAFQEILLTTPSTSVADGLTGL